ncbi:MAG: TIGR02147 family protein [Bdellovibrionales bacterium]
MSNLYSTVDYRDFLRREIGGRGERGLLTRLADQAQCQRSHVSRVLSGKLHFTMDQAFRISRYLGLGDEESHYFMKLVEYARCGDLEYRQSLARELSRLKKEHENLAKRIKDPSLQEYKLQTTYYSQWFWSAVHIAVSIPELQKASALADRLKLPLALVESILRDLEKFNLVRHERGKWFIDSGSIHLPKDSPLNSIQHSNWRARAVQATQNPDDTGVHYTVVQSISRSDFEKIRQLVLKMIDDYAKIARPSKEEELVCFLCDFFRV